MEDHYQQLIELKYEANLLYTAAVLEQHAIEVKTEEAGPFKLFVKPEVFAKALPIVSSLDLDESEVSDECDGYIEGYIEWVDYQYVNGYFTGGKIPIWMYGKTYAQYYGPIIFCSGFYYIAATLFWEGSFITSLIFFPYIVCGYLLIKKGFEKG